ncbi:MAG: translation initiation factor IF-2 subunit alpha [Candidatus Micrarchaeia archaeon]
MIVPELGEYVLASVKKIMPYGAFCTLDEYTDTEAFLHISEVSSGWIRNIREHVKEGQKIVVKVLRVDTEKRQIDLSLKRVTEVDRKRKMEAYKSEKRAVKLLERVATKLKKPFKAVMDQAGAPLSEEFGGLFAAFEAVSQGASPSSKIPAKWLEAITYVARREIKPKKVSSRAGLSLKSFAGAGVEKVKETLLQIKNASDSKTQVEVHYLGAPSYYVQLVSSDHKRIEKKLDAVQKLLDDSSKKNDLEFSLQRQKK